VDWAADAKGLFVYSNATRLRSTLLYVDLQGRAHVLVASEESLARVGDSIADGKYVAMPIPTVLSNAWMLENF